MVTRVTTLVRKILKFTYLPFSLVNKDYRCAMYNEDQRVKEYNSLNLNIPTAMGPWVIKTFITNIDYKFPATLDYIIGRSEK